ncbi:MAG: SGNH/GDSL hydrolase family protein [Isosphaeraceae bacterium]|nr:SGNH/GDSL hydrolase family protein [Isosphaeraceae bacterium]
MLPWKKKLIAAAGGVLVSLVIGELGLRLLGVSFQDFYRADPVRGTSHRPGARGWFRREGRQYIVINSDGFRDRERSRRKPTGVYRVAVLGDSFTEAFQVAQHDAFWAVLERELNGCPAFRGRTVEVLNFGVSDYGTAQELLTLRHCIWDYAPDLILLAFFTGNDVWDNVRTLKSDPEAPYYVLKDGALVLDDSFRNTPRQGAERSWARRALRGVIESSRLLQLVRQAWGVAWSRSGNLSRASTGKEYTASWYQNPIYREPTSSDWAEAWEVTERLLLEMRDEARRHGVQFMVATLSNGPQVHPDARVRQQLARALGVADLDYPDRRLRRFGESAGIAVFNLAPPFRAEAERRQVFLHGFDADLGTGHWNEAGHQLAGRILARWICEGGKRGDSS